MGRPVDDEVITSSGYREIFDASTEAIFVQDATTGALLDVNQTMCEMYRCTRAQARTVDIARFSMPEAGMEARIAAWARRALTEGPQLFEWSGRRWDGTPISVEVALRVATIGGQIRLLGLVRDIWQRLESVARREDSERRYRALFEESNDAIFLMDELVFVDCNPASLKLFGATRAQVVGQTPEALSPTHQPDGRSSAELASHWSATALRGQLQVFSWRHMRVDGTPFDTEVSLTVVTLDQRPHLLAMVRDVTARVHAERAQKLALSRVRRQQRALVELARHPCIVSGDVDGAMEAAVGLVGQALDVSRVNVRLAIGETLTQMAAWGMSFEEAGKPLPAKALMVFSELSEGRVLTVDDVATNALPEVMVRAGVVSSAFTALSSAPIRTGGVVVGALTALMMDGPRAWTADESEFLGAMADQLALSLESRSRHQAETERARLRGQLLHAQRLEAVGEMVGGVAHDFNNLLTAILGYADGLAEDLPEGTLRSDALDICDAAHRASALTTRLLSFSRKEACGVKLVELNEALGGTMRMLSRIMGERIELRFEPDAVGFVQIDPFELEQVVINLANNARDAMPEGGGGGGGGPPPPTPTSSDVGGLIGFEVVDSGVGMDAATCQKIFEPYFTTKSAGRGTGLGLAMVVAIVDEAGGTVTVASEVGVGTTFRVALPLVDDVERLEPVSTQLKEVGGAERILVVEDERGVRLLIGRVLTRLGYQIVMAASAEEALTCVADGGRIDLVVSDVVLPRMSGPSLVERLRMRQPELLTLFISGYAPERIELDASMDFLPKPFSVPALAKAVRALLDARVVGA